MRTNFPRALVSLTLIHFLFQDVLASEFLPDTHPNRVEKAVLTSIAVVWGILELTDEKRRTPNDEHVFSMRLQDTLIGDVNENPIEVVSSLPTEDPMNKKISEVEAQIATLENKSVDDKGDEVARGLRKEAIGKAYELLGRYKEKLGSKQYIPLGKRSLVFLVLDGKQYYLYSVHTGDRADEIAKIAHERWGSISRMDKVKVDLMRRNYRSHYLMRLQAIRKHKEELVEK